MPQHHLRRPRKASSRPPYATKEASSETVAIPSPKSLARIAETAPAGSAPPPRALAPWLWARFVSTGRRARARSVSA